MAEQGMKGSRCVLCLETFKDPRILPTCGHTFCLNCLKQYEEKSETALACPMCRRKITIPAGGLEELFRNYSLCDVLEISTTFGKEDPVNMLPAGAIAEPEVFSCAQHRDKELQLYCIDCSKVICLECVDAGHGAHCLLTISKMAANARIRLQDNVTKVNQKLLQTKQDKDKIEEEKKKLLCMFAEHELAIQKEFEKVKSFLEEHKKTLDLKLMNVKMNLLKQLEIEKRGIEAQELHLRSVTTHAEKVMDGKDKKANLKVLESFKGLNSKSLILMQMQMKIPEICSMTSVTFKPTDLLNTSFFANEQQNLIGAVEFKISSSNSDNCADKPQPPTPMQKPCAKRRKLSRSEVDREGPHIAGDTSNTEAPLGIQQLNSTPDTFQSHFGSDSTASAQNSTKFDDKNCCVCNSKVTCKKECPCKPQLCRRCNKIFSNGQLKCPCCRKVFERCRRNQPPGNMTWRENQQCLPGYNDCGFIEIDYQFNDGIQEIIHPNPGQPYKGTHETAYLPSNAEGREVLRLMERAFNAGLVFTFGKSSRTGQDNAVIWNISHKTTRFGDTGYPDPTYLNRVKAELAAKGIGAEV